MINTGDVSRDREICRTQIFRLVLDDTILDISDMLSDEPKRNKLAITLLQFDAGFRLIRRVRHFVDADDFKLACHDILANAFTSFEDRKGSVHDDQAEARVLIMKRISKNRNLHLQIDNGVGEPQKNGTVVMSQVTQSVGLTLPRWESRKMAMVVLDYVRQWETVNFRRRQESRTVTLSLSTDSARQSEPRFMAVA